MKNMAIGILLLCVLANSQASFARKPLNNLVTELTSLKGQEPAGEPVVRFTNPTEGWCYFLVSGAATVRLNEEAAALPLAEVGAAHTEAMRYLPAGRHTLHIDGELAELTVRAIPVLQHAFYNSGDAWTIDHGSFDDWDYLQAHVLPNVNVIISGGARHPLHFERAEAEGVRWIGVPDVPAWYAREDHLDDWKRLGRSWITSVTVPAGEDITAEQAYAFWSAALGLNEPRMDGVIVDEFPGGDQPKYDAYRRAVDRIYVEPKFKDKTFSPYSCGGGGVLSGYTGKDRCQEFARACIAGGGYVCIERYLSEQPTEALARAHLRKELIDGWNMPRFEKDFPGVAQQTIMVLGYMSAVGESLNVEPGADFKVYMDAQMNMLANDPAYVGLGGIQWYHSGYTDDETIRWASRLFRHYAIEGKRNMLSREFGYRYELNHIRNPDFADGTRGWRIEPAEPDSVTPGQHPKYGYLQFRYTADGTGDQFLRTKRSAQKPNAFSQEIKNLVPGRLYSLKMISGDYADLVEERSNEKRHAVSIRIDNVEMLPEQKASFQSIFPSHYARPVGAFRDNHTYYMNYHWRIFRATSDTARLTVSDWQSEHEPGGPAGQELIFNFVEVQPYFSEIE